MVDVYKLEWTHSRKTIQSGIGEILNKEAYFDTVVVCRDGVMTHNKLTLGLVLPDLHNVPSFDIPLEQTVLMPDHSVVEIQKLINGMFPGGVINNANYETKGDEIEVNIDENNFEHFLESDAGYDTSPRTFGMRRGRGRPPLFNTSRMPPRFQCDFCNKGFYYKSMLSAHEKLHTGGTRETCEVCGAEYSTRQNLKNHMVKHHGAESFVPRKRGRPPIDPEKKISASPYRGRGRPPYKHVNMEGNGRNSGYGGTPTKYGSYNNSNDAIEYQDSNDNRMAIENAMNTESFLEQNLDDGDSDIAEEDDIIIVDPTSEKVEPSTSNEYIEEDLVKEDYKETDANAPLDNSVTVDAPMEQSATEDSSGSGANIDLNEVSQRPVLSQNLPSEPSEKEYQV
eukprot:GFUD01108226.1.p1 GENE.GFUD01108226.1~~GFUD01108226.1.p1  ORF type:complete len:395 (-),score=101.57 GFUD01108226.1:354-1538(-)